MDLRTTLTIACLLFFTVVMPVEVYARTFESDWSSANWQVEQTRMSCRLFQPIADFGVAEFRQRNAEEVRFYLYRDASLLRGGFASIEDVAPAWRGPGKPVLLGKAKSHVGKEVLSTDTSLAVKMLSTLDRGHATRILMMGDANEQIKIELTPLNFQANHARFVQCQGQLLSFDKQSVADTDVYFQNNTTDLNDIALVQLNRIAEYVQADKEIRRVSIAGYSDGAGRTGYNNWISELRAKAVKDYLKIKGIPEDKIKITWYGKKHPQTESTTEIGRSLNRRVNVKLYGF